MPTDKETTAVVMPPTPNSAAEWRKPHEQGVLFHFPSGMKAIVRPVNTRTFILNGGIPDFLSGAVDRMINGAKPFDQMSKDEYLETMGLYDIFCQTCFVSPKVRENPGEDEISPDMISDTDKQTLFQFIGAPASLLESFRPITPDVMDDMVNMSSDPANPQRVHANSPLGESDIR